MFQRSFPRDADHLSARSDPAAHGFERSAEPPAAALPIDPAPFGASPVRLTGRGPKAAKRQVSPEEVAASNRRLSPEQPSAQQALVAQKTLDLTQSIQRERLEKALDQRMTANDRATTGLDRLVQRAEVSIRARARADDGLPRRIIIGRNGFQFAPAWERATSRAVPEPLTSKFQSAPAWERATSSIRR